MYWFVVDESLLGVVSFYLAWTFSKATTPEVVIKKAPGASGKT
ncbi:MAG: hypothetical protein QXL85_08640 [Candidatus Bathyarchaeia archaeon]